MPRWASTARRYCRMGASSGRAAAGREPISRIRTDTLPPVARWFSTSRARSIAVVERSTSSSILLLSSERISTLARAAGGIALMPVPPSISPTLMEDFGLPFEPRLGEQRHGAAQRVDGIADAVIAPAMPARSGEGHLETAAAQGAGGDVVGSGAVHDHEGADLLGERRLLAEVAHPARLPSPSSPTLATSSRLGWRTLPGGAPT